MGKVEIVKTEKKVSVENAKKRKRKRSLIRGPKTRWICFCQEMRKLVKEEKPDLSFGDISKILGKKWRELPEENKEKFTILQKADIARFKRDFENASEEERSLLGRKKVKKKDIVKARSSYNFFVKHQAPIITKNNPQLSFRERGVMMGNIWRELTDVGKQKFIDMNIEDKKRYVDELELKKMEGSGDQNVEKCSINK